jgi:hypothetical protein
VVGWFIFYFPLHQHETMVAAYDKCAQDVGVVIPRGEKFEQTAKNNFPAVTQNNTQSIDLAKMFAPGYKLSIESLVACVIVNRKIHKVVDRSKDY